MATTINAGRVAMVPRGDYSATTAYKRLDVVTYNGSGWLCKADTTGNAPADGSTYWQLLASKGDPGSGGAQSLKTVNGFSLVGEGDVKTTIDVAFVRSSGSWYAEDFEYSDVLAMLQAGVEIRPIINDGGFSFLGWLSEWHAGMVRFAFLLPEQGDNQPWQIHDNFIMVLELTDGNGNNATVRYDKRIADITALQEGLSGKADKRKVSFVTYTADIVIDNIGSVQPIDLEAKLNAYYPTWRTTDYEALNTIANAWEVGTISGVQMSAAMLSALDAAFTDFEVEDQMSANVSGAVITSQELAANIYLLYLRTDAVAPTLPANYDAADEFVFSFTCSTDACVLTLPSGVQMADGFDFEGDRAAGVKFQMSIMDGIAGYLIVSTN